MRRYFVDAFYWVALTNRRDQWHTRVQTFDDALTAYRLYTTDEILTEFLAFYCEGTPHTRRQAALYARSLLANPLVVVFPQTHSVFLEGLTLYESRPDKGYSLRHCSRDPGFDMDMASDHFYTTGSNHFSRGANNVWTG